MSITPEEFPRLSNDTGEWVCVDCGNVSIHLFSPETRKEYNLEGFWEKEVEEFNEEKQLKDLERNEKFLLQTQKRGQKDIGYEEDSDTPLEDHESDTDSDEIYRKQ